jgi:hypothetical protein
MAGAAFDGPAQEGINDAIAAVEPAIAEVAVFHGAKDGSNAPISRNPRAGTAMLFEAMNRACAASAL